jgi:hypothetical protein
MSKNTRPKEDSHWLLPIEACFPGEPFKHLMQLGGELARDEPVYRWRVDQIGAA